jgi:hypothetical protein
MNIFGWIMMIGSITATTTLLIWCLWMIFNEPQRAEHIHSQLDIEPNDREP